MPTRVSHKNYDKYALLGTNAVIYCNASGVPRPKAQWSETCLEKKKMFKSLFLNSNYLGSEVNGDIKSNTPKYTVYEYSIEVKNIEYSDLGKYFCYAKNGIGRTITTIVTMIRGCEIFVSICFNICIYNRSCCF